MSKPMLLSAFLMYVCVVGVCDGWFWQHGCTPPWKRCMPCEWLTTRQVTLVVRNVLREPTFEETVTLDCTRSRTLFYMMMEAADANSVFKFSVSYDHAGHPGFFVNAINERYSQWAEERTWWEILDGDLRHTPVGVSSYSPSDGETVTFNFTQSSGH